MFTFIRSFLNRWFGFSGTSTPTDNSADEVEIVYEAEHYDAGPVPYDENLLERARTQWQFGDWKSLAALKRDTLQHHPDRAKLSLLAAAGHMQEGDTQAARQFTRLAQDWGCSEKIVSQILIAGVHNTLGRAAFVSGQQPRALKHFESAITIGAPNTEVRLITQARVGEQLAQLGLPAKGGTLQSNDTTVSKEGWAVKFTKASHESPTQKNETSHSRLPHSESDNRLPSDFVESFFSSNASERDLALGDLKKTLDSLGFGATPEVCWSQLESREKIFYFAHLEGDYIPGRIADGKAFYEEPFLNLLARLHQPGKLIIDGGANIGNHSIFFAGVMGADVIAFEPQPYNNLLLSANRSLNHLDKLIDIRSIAIGDKKGSINLCMALANNYGSFTSDLSLIKGSEDEDLSIRQKFEVPLSTLDQELIDDIQNISIIKLDLEGMELVALHGARSILSSSKPVVAVECFTNSQYETIKNFLADYDYFVIDSTNATPTFIFLCRSNLLHLEILCNYLELNSVGKFRLNNTFVSH